MRLIRLLVIVSVASAAFIGCSKQAEPQAVNQVSSDGGQGKNSVEKPSQASQVSSDGGQGKNSVENPSQASEAVAKAREVFDKKAEKELLSDALTTASSITPDMAIKDRINLYGKVVQNIEQIFDKYGATDVALTLKSTNKFGDFDVSTIRNTYLTEMSTYYEKICDVTPSNICLGFTSLKNGSNLCETGRDFRTILKAHKELLNAYSIFKNLPDSGGLPLIAKKRYFACPKENPKYSLTDTTDYFNFELIKVLLSVGEKSSAKGLIEQLNGAVYKFYSVIELKILSGETVDDAYVKRIKEFVKEKISQDGIDKQSAMFVLANLSLVSPQVTVYYSELRDMVRQRVYGGKGAESFIQNCPEFEAEALYQEVIKVGFNLRDQTVLGRSGLNKKQTEGFLSNITLSDDPLRYCRKLYNIGMLATGRLLAAGLDREAKVFHSKFMTTKVSEDPLELLDLYLDSLLVDKSKIDSIANAVEGMDGNFVRPGFKKKDVGGVDYAVFKKLVDFEKVCDASRILGKKLKGTGYQTDAVKYMAASPLMAKAKNYKCGDEDLELLLR